MIGIDPAALVPLVEVSDIPSAQERFAAVAADWIEDHFGTSFSWEAYWQYAPHDLLERAFSRGELIWLWNGSHVASKLDAYFQEHEALIWKVSNALWRYGYSRDYRRLIACCNGLSRLAINLPGFDVRITHTRYTNTAAWAAHGRDKPIYLDASLGVLVYYQGKHVMTIGFAPSKHGILLAQVQLCEKRGNRFLYKLPMPYLDFALDLLQRAFPDDALYLVTGTSTTAVIRSAYGKDVAGFLAETAARISRFYDQPLSDYARMNERCSSDEGRVFVRLARSRTRRREAA